jgi:hypothetical protein
MPGDRGIAALAARQYGVVASWQLLALGLSRGAISRRVAAARLHPVHRGVYAVGHSALAGPGRLMAAVLAHGPTALLSHRSGAGWLGILPDHRSVIDVTVPTRSRGTRAGVVVHCVRRLHPDDRTVVDGIPVTSLARTLLDVAETEPLRRLERAFEEAERQRLFDLRALELLCERSRGRRGVRPLRALMAQAIEPPATRSELERRFLDVCRDAGLPAPAMNVVVAGHDVDAAWLDRRLVVELDSRAFHHTRTAFEADRVRDGVLQVAGQRVLRVTHRRLETEPHAVVATVRALLGD